MTQQQQAALQSALAAFLDQEGAQAVFNEAESAVAGAQAALDTAQSTLSNSNAAKDVAFGQAQAQFPSEEVFVIRRNGILFIVKVSNATAPRLSIERVIVTDLP